MKCESGGSAGRPAYFVRATAVASTEAFDGEAFAMPSIADDSELAMPQQLAAGSTIDDETIVSQQAARRQTSRPQQS
ncbi:MAG: hypothetical protein RLZZ111_1840 [Planctomycetota bacterium]|jgi:hypothetical protein